MAEKFMPLIRQASFPGMWIYLPIILFLALLGVWAVSAENDFSFYFRDPAAIVETSPWIGLFSNIGIFLWWMAAVVAVFTGILLRWAPGRGKMSAFFLSWGALTGMLALDDFFMIHEWVVPTYLPLSEDFMFGIYFIVAAFLLVYFRDVILRTPYPVVLFALACFGASLVVDFIGPFRPVEWGLPIRFVWNLEYVVEDGFKLIGIIAWLHYFVLVSFRTLRPYLSEAGETATAEQPARRHKPLNGDGKTTTAELPTKRRKRSQVR